MLGGPLTKGVSVGMLMAAQEPAVAALCQRAMELNGAAARAVRNDLSLH